MKSTASSYNLSTKRGASEKQMIDAKRRQAGVTFPAPRKQNHVLIIRLNVLPTIDLPKVSEGLRTLCTLLEHIDRGLLEVEVKTDEGETIWSSLSRFNFTSTIGFGKRFFKRHNILEKCPKYLYDMPEHSELGDYYPYTLQQTDLILQLASNDYSVNRMVLQNDSYLHDSKAQPKYQINSANSESHHFDIMEAVSAWANITDVHRGFHRTDGRNLMGFYDGISNPDRMLNNAIWIPKEEDAGLTDGTFMVFQKIEHELKEWNALDIGAQEKWVGRSKATGLLLGTLSYEEEKGLVSDIHSIDQTKRKRAITRLRRLIDDQRDPKKRFFDRYDSRYVRIYKDCPILSHVRKVNPRTQMEMRSRVIFRRGYLYTQEELADRSKSGLLFISFQKDVKIFEDMKKDMTQRTNNVMDSRYQFKKDRYFGRKSLVDNSFNTLTLGGGYYFIPSIPNRKVSEIGQQYFK